MVKLFKTHFGNNTLVSFTEFQCQGIDIFGSVPVYTFELFIQSSLLYKECMDTSLKSQWPVVLGD